IDAATGRRQRRGERGPPGQSHRGVPARRAPRSAAARPAAPGTGGGGTPGRACGPYARQDRRGSGRTGGSGREGRAFVDPRGDENGAHHQSARARPDRAHPLPGGRAGRRRGRADRFRGEGMSLPRKVKIFGEGPRDGLQNEATNVPTAIKIELTEKLAEAGLPAVQPTAFVSPEWVPA